MTLYPTSITSLSAVPPDITSSGRIGQRYIEGPVVTPWRPTAESSYEPMTAEADEINMEVVSTNTRANAALEVIQRRVAWCLMQVSTAVTSEIRSSLRHAPGQRTRASPTKVTSPTNWLGCCGCDPRDTPDDFFPCCLHQRIDPAHVVLYLHGRRGGTDWTVSLHSRRDHGRMGTAEIITYRRNSSRALTSNWCNKLRLLFTNTMHHVVLISETHAYSTRWSERIGKGRYRKQLDDRHFASRWTISVTSSFSRMTNRVPLYWCLTTRVVLESYSRINWDPASSSLSWHAYELQEIYMYHHSSPDMDYHVISSKLILASPSLRTKERSDYHVDGFRTISSIVFAILHDSFFF